MVTDEEFEFTGQLVQGMVNWNQSITNAVIENIERQRDEAQENFIRLFDAVARANVKIDSQRLGWIIDDYGLTRDGYVSDKNSQKEVQ